MKYLPHLCLTFCLLFISCQPNSTLLEGKWVNINFDGRNDFLIYEFQKSKFYFSGLDQEYFGNHKIENDKLLLYSNGGSSVYEVNVRKDREIFFTNVEGPAIHLLPKDLLEHDESSFVKIFGLGCWEYEIIGQDDYNDDFLVNRFLFAGRDKAINFFVTLDSSIYVNELDFEIITFKGVSLIHIFDQKDLYLFIEKSEKNLITFIKRGAPNQTYENVVMRSSEGNILKTDAFLNDIAGDWASEDPNSTIQSVSIDTEVMRYAVQSKSTDYMIDGEIDVIAENNYVILYNSSGGVLALCYYVDDSVFELYLPSTHSQRQERYVRTPPSARPSSVP
tara:strand:- start:6 stop:1007 length:1002 start_codon:yes stop_codon:yes gene_type:complete